MVRYNKPKARAAFAIVLVVAEGRPASSVLRRVRMLSAIFVALQNPQVCRMGYLSTQLLLVARMAGRLLTLCPSTTGSSLVSSKQHSLLLVLVLKLSKVAYKMLEYSSCA